MRRRRFSASAYAVLALASAGTAGGGCAPMPSDNCAMWHECAPTGDAGVDQGVAEAGVQDAVSEPEGGNSCDATQAPHDAPCVVDEQFGIFASPAGADGNPGTRALPVLTLSHAMDVAHASGKQRVYACAGSFPEQLAVGASRDGVALYGGLDCASWSYGSQNQVIVAPPQPGYVLDVEGLEQGATFEDLALIAANANPANAGTSSIAVFVAQSQHVVFDRVTVTAGSAPNGAPGAAGGTAADGGAGGIPSNWLGSPPYAQLNGNDALNAAGAPEKACTCPDGSQSGGGQGGGFSVAGATTPGAGAPSYDGGAGAAFVGQNNASCGGGGAPVQNGLDGPRSSNTSSNQTWGSLTASGWTPGLSVSGAVGNPGQGGGGGGSGPGGIGGGGSGACGGCGGAGGAGGVAGGSSIALLSFQSSIALVSCSLTAGNAGAGGAGGAGETGQAGSPMGGNGTAGGCPGGAGGAGSGGSGGQGGAGGVSVGVAYVGAPVTFDGMIVTPTSSLARVTVGAPGAGGAGGTRGSAASTNVGQPQAGADGSPGFAGVAQAVLSF
jgi:hypothetical protein